MLLGEYRADESDDCCSVGEDPDNVGAPADFTVETLCRIVRPHLCPHRFRCSGKRENLIQGLFQVVGNLGETLVTKFDNFPGLVPGGPSVGLLEYGMKHPRQGCPAPPRDRGREVVRPSA